MAAISAYAPVEDETTFAPPQVAIIRAAQGFYVCALQTGVADGCDVHQNTVPDLNVVVDTGNVVYANDRLACAGGTLDLTAHVDPSNAKIVIIYVDSAGAPQVLGGSASAVTPAGETDWHAWYTPSPATASIPAGVILAMVRIDAAETTILDADIYDIPVIRQPPKAYTYVKRVTHDGGGTQTIATVPAHCDIAAVAVKCIEASATRTVLIGTAGDTDMLLADADVPKVLNNTKTTRYPTEPFTTATAIIASVGGSGDAGEWDVTLYVVDYT